MKASCAGSFSSSSIVARAKPIVSARRFAEAAASSSAANARARECASGTTYGVVVARYGIALEHRRRAVHELARGTGRIAEQGLVIFDVGEERPATAADIAYAEASPNDARASVVRFKQRLRRSEEQRPFGELRMAQPLRNRPHGLERVLDATRAQIRPAEE